MTVDGEAVLIQVARELVDMAALSFGYDVAETYVPKVSIVYKHLVAQAESGDPDGTCLRKWIWLQARLSSCKGSHSIQFSEQFDDESLKKVAPSRAVRYF